MNRYINSELKREILKQSIEHWPPALWSTFYVLSYDSDIYSDVRDFSIVFDLKYDIKYVGRDCSDISSTGDKYPNNIYYIIDLDDDSYLFFDKNLKDLNNGLKFMSTFFDDDTVYVWDKKEPKERDFRGDHQKFLFLAAHKLWRETRKEYAITPDGPLDITTPLTYDIYN